MFSRDITPMDFTVWGFVKDAVYENKINSIAELRLNVTDVPTAEHLEED